MSKSFHYDPDYDDSDYEDKKELKRLRKLAKMREKELELDHEPEPNNFQRGLPRNFKA